MAEQFFGLVQVVNVGTAEVLAGIARATFHQRGEVALVACTRKVETAPWSVERRIACHAGRRNAVKGICAILNCGEDIVWLGNTQQVTWLVLRQLLGAPANDGAQIFLFQCAANTDTVTSHCPKFLPGLAAQFFILGTLDDAEQCLVVLSHTRISQREMLGNAPLSPTASTFKGLDLVAARVLQGGQLVKGEHRSEEPSCRERVKISRGDTQLISYNNSFAGR